MLWIICAILSGLLIALSVATFIKKNKGSMRVVAVLVYLFLATYILYLPAYLESFDFFTGLLGDLVHVLQVATIDADFMEFYSVIQAGFDAKIIANVYSFIQAILHVALPTVSALTAVTVLLRCYSTVQLWFANKGKKQVFVFSEINDRSLSLAKSLKDIKCSIIFANSGEDAYSGYNEGSQKFIFKEEAIDQLKITTTGKQVHFFCLSKDEDYSLGCTLRLIEKYREICEKDQQNVHIYQFSTSEDFAVFIDSAEKGMLDVQCINEYEKLVYKLFDEYPFPKYTDSKINLLLYGMQTINVVALKTAVWCAQLSGFTLTINVVGVNIDEKIENLKVATPNLFKEPYKINFYDCKSEKQTFDVISDKCIDSNYIIVGGTSDNQTMKTGIELRRLFYKKDEKFSNCPPIFCFVRDNAKTNILKNLATAETNAKRRMSYNLIAFGDHKDVYTYSQLVDSSIEKLAKNVHLAYEEIFSDGPIDVQDALRRYNVFEVNKRSNRANALHIRFKLNLLGLDYAEESQEDINLQDYYTEESLDKLAFSEHDRWRAFLESEGWTGAEKSEVEAYRESGISKGRHNCPILKKHPYICEFDKLYDLSMALEGKDTTVYDKELIVRIPDILSDKWNVSGKKYKIIKLEKK